MALSAKTCISFGFIYTGEVVGELLVGSALWVQRRIEPVDKIVSVVATGIEAEPDHFHVLHPPVTYLPWCREIVDNELNVFKQSPEYLVFFVPFSIGVVIVRVPVAAACR